MPEAIRIVIYMLGIKADRATKTIVLPHSMLPLLHRCTCHITYQAMQRLVLSISFATSAEVEYPEIDLPTLPTLRNGFTAHFIKTIGRIYQAAEYTVVALLHLVRDVPKLGLAFLLLAIPGDISHPSIFNVGRVWWDIGAGVFSAILRRYMVLQGLDIVIYAVS